MPATKSIVCMNLLSSEAAATAAQRMTTMITPLIRRRRCCQLTVEFFVGSMWRARSLNRQLLPSCSQRRRPFRALFALAAAAHIVSGARSVRNDHDFFIYVNNTNRLLLPLVSSCRLLFARRNLFSRNPLLLVESLLHATAATTPSAGSVVVGDSERGSGEQNSQSALISRRRPLDLGVIIILLLHHHHPRASSSCSSPHQPREASGAQQWARSLAISNRRRLAA